MNYPSFSIVVNTLDRASKLKDTLESFRWLDYKGNFEVIVVNGPSKDSTETLLKDWQHKIKILNCELKNLSISRNIGICGAAGDIVAFIDDDAIPEPEWLKDLAKAYQDPNVGAAGGFVFNQTGYDYQKTFEFLDRWGDGYSSEEATPQYSFPKSWFYPHLLGCNCSFRKSALLEVKGFDEEYEYFLDETDLLVRIVDAGYKIAQLPCAFVHHKFAPSFMRSHNSVFKERYPIIKNKIYFQIKHASEFNSPEKILDKRNFLIENQKEDVDHHFSNGNLTIENVNKFNKDYKRALEVGIRRGEEGQRAIDMITPTKIEKYSMPFKKFQALKNSDSKNIILISRYFKPYSYGGIATFTNHLAESLAKQGHNVHVISESQDICRVDWENGVWIHRILIKKEDNRPLWATYNNFPADLWAWSETALKEAKRINSHHEIDIVEAPIWDCEGSAFLVENKWPLITSLHTCRAQWLDYYPKSSLPKEWVDNHLNPLMKLEACMMTNSDGIRANSKAVIDELENRYGIKMPINQTKVIYHGIDKVDFGAKKESDSPLEVLFVGRLELRKGIDTLIEAIPKVLKDLPDIKFRIIGEKLIDNDGRTFEDIFYKSVKNKKFRYSVLFEGKVDQETLEEAYKNCDIFVAPSKFESFGLIFLEAMRYAKPVIGTQAGGMPEIISHNKNGILIPPGNPDKLAEAIMMIAENKNIREEMGEESIRIFNEKFTSKRMAEESNLLYEQIKNDFVSNDKNNNEENYKKIKFKKIFPEYNSSLSLGVSKNYPVYLRKGDLVSDIVENENSWDLDLINFFENAMDNSSLKDVSFIDIGANIGLISRQILGRIDNNLDKVYCYEPSIDNFQFINYNLIFSNKIILMNYGLGKKDAEVQLYKDPFNAGNYSIKNEKLLFGYLKKGEKLKNEMVQIKNITIESKRWIESSNNIFLKSKTQGMDITLASLIPFEIWENNIYATALQLMPFENTLDYSKFSKILDLYKRKSFLCNPKEQLNSDEIINYIKEAGPETTLIMKKI